MITDKQPQETLKSSVDRFIFQWHDYPFDFWWRRKYHVPFGSAAHKEMSFIDMVIEWREEAIVNRAITEDTLDWTEEDEENLGLKSAQDREVRMSQREIESDYENLDISQFDK